MLLNAAFNICDLAFCTVWSSTLAGALPVLVTAAFCKGMPTQPLMGYTNNS